MKGHVKLKSITHLLVFLILLTPVLSAQTANKNDSTQEKITALKLEMIPDYGKQTRKLINDIQKKISDDKNLDEISLGIADVVNAVDAKLGELSDTLQLVQLDRLVKEEREVALLNQRILDWKTKIQEIINDGRNKDSVAFFMIQIWQLTLGLNEGTENRGTTEINKNEIPNDLQNEILNFITDR